MAKWIKITNLTDHQEKMLFVQSKRVYETLFPSAYREPWQNFEKYVRDTEERRKFEHSLDPEDHYFVGTAAGMVWGMMFFTTYYKKLGFIAYMGVADRLGEETLDQHERRLLVDSMPDAIARAMNDAECTSFLFELEKISPEKLGRAKTQDLTQLDRQVRNRILVTNAFQKRGARKIGWVTYRQPKLEWDREDQEISMHLMYAPTSKFVPVQRSLDRKQVATYLRFVYLTFYLDGFKSSEASDRISINRWRRYLKNLAKFSLDGIPKTVALQTIDLFARESSVFISYSQKDLRAAQQIQEYLETLGIPVFYWERGMRLSTGEPVWDVIEDWMESCKLLVFVLTKNTFHSEGQLKEIQFVRKNRMRLGQILPLFSNPVSPANIEIWFDCQLVGKRFTRNTLCKAVEDLATQVLNKSQDIIK
jgi:hypothetical protein